MMFWPRANGSPDNSRMALSQAGASPFTGLWVARGQFMVRLALIDGTLLLWRGR